MTVMTQTAVLGANPFRLRATIVEFPTTKDNSKDDVYTIEDIHVTTINGTEVKNALLAVGVLPSGVLTHDVIQKALLATATTAIVSIWVSHIYLLEIFFLLSILNFVGSLFFEKAVDFRTKLSYLLADYFYLGVTATFTELMLGGIEVPLLNNSVGYSIFAFITVFMILGYIKNVTRIVAPLTILSRSGSIKLLADSVKTAIEAGADHFKKGNNPLL